MGVKRMGRGGVLISLVAFPRRLKPRNSAGFTARLKPCLSKQRQIRGLLGNRLREVQYRDGPKMEIAARIRAAISSGRIVPTEARPSELSGCIVGAGGDGVKAKSTRK